MSPRMLPEQVRALCDNLGAPPRLVAHLMLVHDVANELVDALMQRFPRLSLDRAAILLGAATHDLGKVIHPEELTAPGSRHERAGEALLLRHGLPPHIARFARTHALGDRAGNLEDLIVALADAVWKGKRSDPVEHQAAKEIARLTGTAEWEAWSDLDEILDRLSEAAEARLHWQQGHAL